MIDTPGWWSETATAIVSVIVASAAGRILFIGYQLKDSERHIVAMWLVFELFAAVIMGLIALGAVDIIQRVFEIDLYGWPSYSIAAIFGWLGPKGLQSVMMSVALRNKKK